MVGWQKGGSGPVSLVRLDGSGKALSDPGADRAGSPAAAEPRSPAT